jgi:hypothetical protein
MNEQEIHPLTLFWQPAIGADVTRLCISHVDSEVPLIIETYYDSEKEFAFRKVWKEIKKRKSTLSPIVLERDIFNKKWEEFIDSCPTSFSTKVFLRKVTRLR